MTMDAYKILITTSGIGSRLGTLTQYTNKSLVTVGNKAAISHIIESYPEHIELVITIGHYGSHVKDYITLAYPNRNITFVPVDRFDGPGSSLVYSMLCAKEHLQCPFVFHASDTILLEPVSVPSTNWLGGYKGTNSSDYRSFRTNGDQVSILSDKGESNFDYLYIGVAGIHDYTKFWHESERCYAELGVPSDADVIISMLNDDTAFHCVPFSFWHDIGNIKSLQEARSTFKKSYNVLDKEDEALHVFDDHVIKFFADETVVSKRVKRAKILQGLVPEITGHRPNFYKYKKVYGETLSKVVTPHIFNNLLEWTDTNLWSKKSTDQKYYDNCKSFYYDKTLSRIDAFVRKSGRKDKTEVINECETPSVSDILSLIPHDFLCTPEASYYHGDYIAENVLFNNGGFTLIDYRQDFAGDLTYGDMYYDLAKMGHNIIFNHDIVSKGHYEISITSSNIHVDILRRHSLCMLQDVFYNYLERKGYSRAKTDILTNLIWINMSALHQHPLNLFLYYFGRSELWQNYRKYLSAQ